MTERPILFSAPMVRAILAGKKSVTRRICKPANDKLSGTAASVERAAKSGWIAWWPSPVTAKETAERYDDGFRCPYGEPGDRLWVRETWAHTNAYDGNYILDKRKALYKADEESQIIPNRWKPSIHMPRWASRITLEVTDVRVERLQEITEEEAIAEGFEGHRASDGYDIDPFRDVDARDAFAELWDELNGKKYPWANSPWIWRVAFQVLSPSVARSNAR